MKVDVAFTPAGIPPGEVAGRTVFVVDVLRATTTICAALANGARGVIPVGSIDEAMKLAQTLERRDVLLAGERNATRISGFDLGNSPLEMTETSVKGRTLVMTTTNGTRALLASAGATAVFVASAVNLSVAGARAREAIEQERDLLVICAGREGSFGLDDAYTAGRLVSLALDGRRIRKGLNDAALVSQDLVRRYGSRWLRPLMASRAGRELVGLGFRDDVALAADQDRFPVLPQFADRRIILVPVSTPVPATAT